MCICHHLPLAEVTSVQQSMMAAKIEINECKNKVFKAIKIVLVITLFVDFLSSRHERFLASHADELKVFSNVNFFRK